MKQCWAILTGEYPPQPGGVSDYTRRVADGLARAGDEVHVWAPACGDAPDHSAAPTAPGLPPPGAVGVHRLAGGFNRAGLAALGDALATFDAPPRLLVQYVPHAFGFKAMNVPLCRWLARRPEALWVMFHEVRYPFALTQPPRHNLLAAVTHAMARMLVRAAARAFVSIPAWEGLLRPMLPRRRRASAQIAWLPVPSNLPTSADPVEVSAVRGSVSRAGSSCGRECGDDRDDDRGDAPVVGHFGTFGPLIRPLLAQTLSHLLEADPRCRILLIGRGGEAFAADFSRQHPRFAPRLTPTGDLPPAAAVAHLSACDLLLQPYPDGATGRRSSLMAGLALGVPIVATAGRLTEPLWREAGAVALADGPGALAALARDLLADARRRVAQGNRAKALYEARFAVRHTIAALRGGAGAGAPDVSRAVPHDRAAAGVTP